MKIRTIVLGSAVAALMAGCYEDPGVTVYEPGVYKGSQDPLTQTQADTRADTLQKRFSLVQTDR